MCNLYSQTKGAPRLQGPSQARDAAAASRLDPALDVVPALNVSVAQAARELGISRQLLHGILAEKLPVSAEMAVRLGKRCGNDGHLWIALRRDYDLWQAERKLAGRISGIPTREAA